MILKVTLFYRPLWCYGSSNFLVNFSLIPFVVAAEELRWCCPILQCCSRCSKIVDFIIVKDFQAVMGIRFFLKKMFPYLYLPRIWFYISLYKKFLFILTISKTFVFFLRTSGKFLMRYGQGSVFTTDP